MNRLIHEPDPFLLVVRLEIGKSQQELEKSQQQNTLLSSALGMIFEWVKNLIRDEDSRILFANHWTF